MTPSEQLLAHDDFVRRLAQSLLRDAHRAEDLAQETWLAVLRHGPPPLRSVRAWLTAVVRHLAAKSVRAQQAARRLEPRGARAESVPAVDELLSREAERQRLVAAVVALEEPYREAVILRWFEELPPSAIARRLGVPVETVRTRIKRGLAMLRARLDAEHGGDGRSWILGLATLWPARRPAAMATLFTASAGVLFMTLKIKTLAAAAMVLGILLLGAWTLGVFALGAPTDDNPAPAAPIAATTPPVHAATRPAEEPGGLASRRAEMLHTAATTGALRIAVRYGADGTPAAGAWVRVVRFDPKDSWFLECKDAQADAEGTLVLDDEAPGKITLYAYQGGTVRAEVVAGGTREVTLVIPPGVDVVGDVVDADGKPVAGAGLWLGGWPQGRVVATTRHDGTFLVRSVLGHTVLGAVAEGHGPSFSEYVLGRAGATHRTRLVLGRAVSFAGRVTDANGTPVAGAQVLVGSERTSGFGGFREMSPRPLLLTSDADGGFRANDLRRRDGQMVQVRAPGFAPWSGNWYPGVSANPFAIRLARGTSLSGTVRDEHGRPVPGAFVTVGRFREFASARTSTAADGTYRLSDLPAGEFTVGAYVVPTIMARAKLTGAGAELRWDPLLESGGTLSGVVVDEHGAPLPGLRVVAGKFAARTVADAQGNFAFDHLADERMDLAVYETDERQEFPIAERAAVPVGPQPVRLVVPLAARATAGIGGAVLAFDGQCLEEAQVTVRHADSGQMLRCTTERGTGRFRSGPIPAGRYSLTVIADWNLAPLELPARDLAPGETWDAGTLRLERPGTALFEVVTADGTRPAGGVHVQLTGPSGETAGAFSQEESILRAPPLLPGVWRARASGGVHQLSDETPLTIRPGETTRLRLTLRPATSRRFRITWDGEAPQHVRVVFRDGEGRIRSDSGPYPPPKSPPLFLSPTLDVGTFVLEATTPDGRKATAKIEIADLTPVPAEIELRLQ